MIEITELRPGDGTERSGRPKILRKHVKRLQLLLQLEGFDVEVTSEFDEQTETAVRTFQESRHIDPHSAIVNDVTWQELLLA